MPFRILSILRTSRAKVEITEKVRLPCAMVFPSGMSVSAALDIDMDPLMVATGFGERIDALLCDDQPSPTPSSRPTSAFIACGSQRSLCHDILPQTDENPALSQGEFHKRRPRTDLRLKLTFQAQCAIQAASVLSMHPEYREEIE